METSLSAADQIARLSDRDREILRAQVADKIAALLPMTQMGLPWQASFEKDAARLRTLGAAADRNPALADYLLDAIALGFVLYEASE